MTPKPVIFDDVHKKIDVGIIKRIQTYIEWISNGLQEDAKAIELDELFHDFEVEVYNKTLLVITQKSGTG